MEFPFLVSNVSELTSDGFLILATSDFDPISQLSRIDTSLSSFSASPQRQSKEQITKVLDMLGKSSAKAQDQKHIVTSYNKFMSSIANKIYIKVDAKTVLGYLRIEIKKLSFQDSKGIKREAKFLCLIDFYVPESHQRIGIGKTIFQKMLDTEQTQASKLAYRRPSLEMFSFLKRYYGLTDYITQNTGHAIFKVYLETLQPIQRPSINQLTSQSSEDWGTDKKKRDSIKSTGHNEERSDLQHRHRLSKFGSDIGSLGKNILQRRLNTMDPDASRQESNHETEKSKLSSRKNSNDSQETDQSLEEEKKLTGEELIDALLKAPSVLDNNVFQQRKHHPIEIKGADNFENEAPRKFYEELYRWNWNLKAELERENKYFKEKLFNQDLPQSQDELEFTNKITLLQRVFGLQENGSYI